MTRSLLPVASFRRLSRSVHIRMTPVIFIIGTDTGVGKTLMTCLLLEWLKMSGVDALAIKPFISGGRHDARILQKLQRERLSLDDISPFQYGLALAPAIAAENQGTLVPLRDAISHVERIRKRCNCLLVEGCGGLLSPLGTGFSALEMIKQLQVHVVVVARNRLGALNHILLTLRALESTNVESVRVALMNRVSDGELVQRTNLKALGKLVNCSVSLVPDLGRNACVTGLIKAKAKFLQKTLAGLVSSDTFTSLLGAAGVKATVKEKKRRP